MLDLGPIDGIVGCDVEVVEIRGDFISLGNVSVVFVFAACDSVCLTQALGLLESLMGPHTGIEVCSLLLKIVHCHIEEL